MRILSKTNDIKGYHGTIGTPTNMYVDRYISDVPVSEIGKTVFLTSEEAEKALDKMK